MENYEKHGYILWIIVAIVLTAILVGGGVYYYQNKKAADKTNELNAQITNLQNQINTLKSATTTTKSTATSNDETANWKTYNNTTYGFSFKYPADWFVMDAKDNLTQQMCKAEMHRISASTTYCDDTNFIVNIANVKAYCSADGCTGEDLGQVGKDIFDSFQNISIRKVTDQDKQNMSDNISQGYIQRTKREDLINNDVKISVYDYPKTTDSPYTYAAAEWTIAGVDFVMSSGQNKDQALIIFNQMLPTIQFTN